MGKAQAHPGGAALGQRVDATLTRTDGGLRLDLAYLAEVPAIRIQAEARPMGLLPGAPTPPDALERYTARRLDELTGGVAASWNGEPVALAAAPVEAAITEGEGGFVDFHVAKVATLPGDEGELRLVNRNFPDEGGYFATYVQLDGGLVVTSSSLAQVKDGHLKNNKHGAWLRDESFRESTVAVRPATFWEERDTPASLPERMAGLDSLQPPTATIGAVAGGGLIAAAVAVWLLQRKKA